MAEQLPQEALVRVFHFLPIKQRSVSACVCKSWRQASLVDAVRVKLQKQHVPSYLHVALPDGSSQLQAAACPMMSLARSADITWASAVTSQLLESMPSLERLAFTSMSSVPALDDGGAAGGLQSFRSLRNLQSLHLNTDDAAPVLEGVTSIPSLKEVDLHLTGDTWESSVFDRVATTFGSQATQLQSLTLRCSHASVYATTSSLESLSRLTGLTSLRMGPNPEDIFPHMSPLGFTRLPGFLPALTNLQQLDISMADCAPSASLSGVDFTPISHVPQVTLTLRADRSVRAVTQLPPSLAAVSGLVRLTVQSFAFEDPGGWNTHAYFDLQLLKSCRNLQHLELQLGTWECEHCEVYELPGLSDLPWLLSLKVTVGSRFICQGQACNQVQELLLQLPAMKPAQDVHISSSMKVVLRNSKTLARAKSSAVLALSIVLEEPLPQRKPSTAAAAKQSAAAHDAATHRRRDQQDAAGRSPDVVQGRDQSRIHAAADGEGQQQYVRASAHVVVSALRDLWPGFEVWQYPMKLPGLNSWQQVMPELLCQVSSREEMQQQLWKALVTTVAEEDEQQQEELLKQQQQQPLQQQRSGGFFWR